MQANPLEIAPYCILKHTLGMAAGNWRLLNMKHYIKHRAVSITLVVLTFTFFMVFFTKLHPIALLDSDSWYYAYHHRHAWPVWKSWNPTRVFPEVFMPLVSMFSAHIIYPITGDYFFSLTIGYSLVVSAAITLLTWMVYRHFYREGNGSIECLALAILFLICHFLILCSDKNNNKYMLLTDNTCTYFYYVLPNLMNCILVIWLMDDKKLLHFFSANDYLRKSGFLLLAYFCVFSNLWASMILGIYAGVILLIAFIKAGKTNKGWLGAFIKEHAIFLLILVLWALAQYFELNGDRANQIKTVQFGDALRSTLSSAQSVLSKISHPFLWTVAILCVGGIGVTIWKKRWSEVTLLPIVLMIVSLVAIYLVLSCAVAAPSYISRPDTFYGLFFYFMLIPLVSFRQIMRHLPHVKFIVPICLVILTCECNTSDITYLNQMYYNLNATTCYQVDNDILEQMRSAVEAGKNKTVLYVPKFNDGDNFPIATYAKKRIATHLYKLGVLPRKIQVTEIIPTEDKNKEFHIKIN